jgi:hypothetical protein
MEHSPDSGYAGKELNSVLMEPEGSFCGYQGPLLVPILNQIIPFHILTHCYF